LSETSEYAEKVKRMRSILLLVSVALFAVILIFFLATKVLTPPPAVYDFRLELNTTRVEVFQGKTVNTLITLVPEGAFQGSVTLEIENSDNIYFSLSNWVLSSSSKNAVLSLNTSSIAPGSYLFDVSGSYLEITRRVRLTVVVKEPEKPWFEARATIQPPSIMQTEKFLLNVSIIPHAEFNDTISIAIKGLQGSWFEPSLIEKGKNKTAISVYTSRSTPAGVNNFTMVLNSTSHETTLNLAIEVSEAPPASFQISFSPNITIVKPGDAVNIKVSVRPFYGFNETVHVYSSHIGLSLREFNGSSFVLTPRNYSMAVMMMKTDRNLNYGIYELTFIVETSSEKDFRVLKIGVANVSSTFKTPSPSIIGYSPIADASRGQKVTLNFLTGAINGFEGMVILRVRNVTGPNIGIFYFSTGEGFPKMGVSIERLNITAGEARFIFLSAVINRNIASGIYRVNVELCIEYTPPNMAFPLLNATSVYTVEFHID